MTQAVKAAPLSTTINPDPSVILTDCTLRELINRSFPPDDFLLAPWFQTTEYCLLYASAGVGKSLLAASIALTVAGGGTLAGWHAPRARRVYLIDGEVRTAQLRKRLQDLIPAIPGIDPDIALDNLRIFSSMDQPLDAIFPDLAEAVSPIEDVPSGQDIYLDRILKSGAELVIFDGLTTLSKLSDENAADSFQPVQSFFMKLRRAGIAVILVHHAGKHGDTPRGTSGMLTTPEAAIYLKPRATKNGNASFDLSWKKYRGEIIDENTTKPISMTLQRTNGTLHWLTGAPVPPELHKLVQAAQTHLFATQSAFAAHLGISQGTVSKHLKEAIAAGLLTQDEWDHHLAAAKGALLQNDDAEAESLGF